MLTIRTTKTASGATAVQVVKRAHQQTTVVKHIGSAQTQKRLEELLSLARSYIAKEQLMKPLFPEVFAPEDHLVSLNNIQVTNDYYHHFAYEFFAFFYAYNGFSVLQNKLLQDFAIIRIVEPASKVRSLQLLKEYFGITHGYAKLYKTLRKIKEQKADIEKAAVTYAKQYLSFDFTMVFYDVTTLYFETFKEDEEKFRRPGYSKDNKHEQPQILIGLVVTREGYPISIELFEGKTFEGKTMIPIILALQQKYHIENLTVVADAAMLSFKNMEDLRKNNLQYIVGARIGSLSDTLTRDIAQAINKTEGIVIQKETPHGTLLCDYTKQRAAKDKYDREKQLQKAKIMLEQKPQASRRFRFLKATGVTGFELNKKLIAKDALLDGLKGYYTNITNMNPELIIARYKDLWHVEKSFRIAKSDLEARPIYHHKKDTIEAHILIVFVSLCIAKSIELLTNRSIRRVKDTVWRILDITLEDKLTKQTVVRRMDTTTNEMAQLVENLRKTL
jgi:transposase